jgi:hypothetical protein
MQKFGSSCFLQAACVAMSYLLHAHGESVPPANASRLIRHHFDDEQLIKYVEDDGGDSVGIFKILEEKFFVCPEEYYDRSPIPVLCNELDDKHAFEYATSLLRKGPGLVSKFRVPSNFLCSPPSSDLKIQFPDLAPYEEWAKIPAHLIPPGFARFTKWHELAEFIPLNDPSDAGLKEKERVLKEKWEALLLRSAQDYGQSTDITPSMSVDSSAGLTANSSLPTLSERSTTGSMDGDSDGKDWSDFFMLIMMMMIIIPVHHLLSLEKGLMTPHCMQWSFLGIT